MALGLEDGDGDGYSVRLLLGDAEGEAEGVDEAMLLERSAIDDVVWAEEGAAAKAWALLSSAMVASSITAVGAAVKGADVGSLVRRVGLKEGVRVGRLVGELFRI